MSWFGHGSRAVAVLLLAVVLVWTVAACGSGAVEGPDDEASSDGGGGGNGGGGGGNDEGGNDESGNDEGGNDEGGDTDRDRYSWDLPVGDITPDAGSILYEAFLNGGCDGAARELEGGSGLYGELSAEKKRLYDAAIAVCRGDVELGRTLFAGAGYGASRSMCYIYAAVVSVLEQRPPDISGCPDEPGTGTSSTTESEESGNSTESTSTTEAEPTTSTDEGETTTTEATGAGDGGG